MSNIQISLTNTIEKCGGKLVIQEKCSLCGRPQKNELPCIRHEKLRKIICKVCIKEMAYLDLRVVNTDPSQVELNFK